jgi:hypothetical protein
MRGKLLILLVMGTLALTLWLLQSETGPAQSVLTFDSPILTPSPPPVPSPSPSPSDEAQKALQYISEREGIPVEGLFVVNDLERTFPLIGRTFRDILILDVRTTEGQEYSVLVDLADGRIEDDLNAIEDAEENAYRAKYGKFHPSLYERLQEIGDDDLLPVAFWVAGNAQVRTQEEVFAELAARHPEAVRALEREGVPWAVDNADLAEEIRAEYRQMRAEDTTVRVEPLVEHLGARGFEARTYGSMPSVSAFLPKRVILELAKREEVGLIYLIEEQGSVETDTAIPTDRVPAVWQRGYHGSGVRIANLGPGNIHDDVDCLDIVARRDAPAGDPDHNTMIASVAACDDDTYTGVAPGAQIVDAGFNNAGWPGGPSMEDAVEALRWAIQNAGAQVVVASIKWEIDNNVNWTDRAFDYWARDERVVITKSSGNNTDGTGRITSPGKAWNIITVGGTDDAQNAAWLDDEMWDDSSYINPVGYHREKPEVVGPAVSIKSFLWGNFADERTGTSLAAPQVAGLAALLIDRNSSMGYWPMAVKAIIMASAINNVDGPSDIPTGDELRDGAGSIDAALAEEIAKNRSYSYTTPCDGPCWWGANVYPRNNDPPVGGSRYVYFNASRGERIRVAISWWSNADPPAYPAPNNLARDELDTNFNLYVYAPSGTRVGYTASRDNNYELADFVAPETGTYKIRVYRSAYGDNNEESNRVGIAWVKDATYLPDLRRKHGWLSEFHVCNEGSQPRSVYTHYFETDGTAPSYTNDNCYLNPGQCCSIAVNHDDRIPDGHERTAIVSGGEDVSVVLENQNGSIGSVYAFNGVAANALDAGWAQVGKTLYAPVIMRDYWGWYSELVLVNAGSTSTTANVTYYRSGGGSSGPYPFPLAPNERVTTNYYAGAEDELYAAHITADQPLAAIVRQYGGSVNETYNCSASGGTVIHAPLIMNDYYGWDTSVNVQNTTNGWVYVTRQYYDSNGQPAGGNSQWIRPYSSHSYYSPDEGLPSDFIGTARISAPEPVVVVVNQSTPHGGAPQRGMSYSGTLSGSRFVMLPNLVNYHRGPQWVSSVNVLNLGSSSTVATLAFAQDSRNSPSIPSGGFFSFYTPNYWGTASLQGPATVSATQPLAVVVNHSGLNYTWLDLARSYMGVHR